MNAREREQYNHMVAALIRMGFSASDIDSLRRIERKLHRLGELQCNGIMRGGHATWTEKDQERADREEKRLAARAQEICDSRSGEDAERTGRVIAYHQGDPRGGALVIVPADKLAGRDINSLYSTVGIYV